MAPNTKTMGGGGESHGIDIDLESNGGKSKERTTETFSSLYHLSEPCSLSWRNVDYSLTVKKQKKVILKNVAGHLSPGKLLAILGPSGSGKTSLLNVLAGRVTVGELSGEILLNGAPRSESFRLLSAYVIQDDAMFHTLTAKETILIAAELRLPSHIPLEKKQGVAEKVIKELGLSKVANTCIGNALMRGISGGEKKRVNIGIEMMGNPSLVFLDGKTAQQRERHVAYNRAVWIGLHVSTLARYLNPTSFSL